MTGESCELACFNHDAAILKTLRIVQQRVNRSKHQSFAVGSIPEEFSRMSNLTLLSLNSNNLTGGEVHLRFSGTL